MKKKTYSALLAAAAASGLSISVANAADYELSFAHVLIEETPNGQAAIAFKDYVEDNSDGRIEVNVLPAAQVGGDVEIIEQIQAGIIDIGIPPTATLGNFEPRMQILDLPFLLSDHDTMVEVLDGPVGRDILDTLDGTGMTGINFWGAGFRHMTNDIRPLEGPNDLEGVRMRTMQSPIIISTYENFDANATAMAFTEVYNGLQQGVVEGQENPLANIDTMRFYEVQDHMTLTNHAYHGYAAVINDQTFDSLPAELQEVVTEGFEHGQEVARELTLQDEAGILERISSEIEVQELTEDQKAEFMEASMAVHEEYEEVVTTELLHSVYDAIGIEY